METFISILLSINKIALLALVLTFCFFLYELFLFIKVQRNKKTIQIPDFKNARSNIIKPIKIADRRKNNVNEIGINSHLFLMFLALFLFFFILILMYFFSLKKTNINKNETRFVYIESSGIKVYDSKWREINEKSENIRPGDILYIGVATIRNADINKARIRVNSNSWKKSDETTQFNPKYKIYYIEYKVASNESVLKIEANLHSKKEGWLEE